MSTERMNDFYDIYGMWHIPWWQTPLVQFIAWLIGALFLLLFIIFLVKKITSRKKRALPWEVAYKELVALESPDNLNESTAKIFYTRLTTIVKQYICNRYDFDIQGKTDREILAYLDEQIAFNRELLPVVQDILSHASYIKFANIPGLVEQMKHDVALGIRLVKETIPLPL